MENIYQTPKSELLDEEPLATTPQRLFKTSAVAVATLFGAIFSGGIVLAVNYYRLNETRKGNLTLGLTAAATLMVLILSVFIPESWNVPRIAYNIPQTLVMMQLAHSLQADMVDAHLRFGGQVYSNWMAFLIGIVTSALTILLFAGLLLVSAWLGL